MRFRSPAKLGALIRQKRRKLGLDQKALAEQVGVSRQWITDVEKGKARAALGLVLRTANVLGIPLDASDEPPRQSRKPGTAPDIDAIIDAARKRRSSASVNSPWPAAKPAASLSDESVATLTHPAMARRNMRSQISRVSCAGRTLTRRSASASSA